MAASKFTAFLIVAVAVVVAQRVSFVVVVGVIPGGLAYTALSSNLSVDFINIQVSDLNLYMFKIPTVVSVSSNKPWLIQAHLGITIQAV